MINKTTKEIREKAKCIVPLECQKGYEEYVARFLSLHTARFRAILEGIQDLPVLSILITGPTGSGKSYVMKALAEAAGVNLITIDCSALSRTGWKGNSLNDILCEKLKKKQMSSTIVWFDEFDKLRFFSENTVESNPQFNFLKLYDGEITGEVDREPLTVDTRTISFIYSGAFEGIEDIVNRRIKPDKRLGFGTPASKDSSEPDRTITIDDIKEYGILAELCGRIGSIYSLSPLSENDYRTLLKGYDGSVLTKFENLFACYGVDLDMTNAACNYLANKASQSEFGARSAGPIVYDLLQKTIPDLETKEEIHKITIDYTEEKGVFTKYSKIRKPKPKKLPETKEEKTVYDYSSEEIIHVDDINLYPYIQTGRHREIVSKMMYLYKSGENQEEDSVIEIFLKTCVYFLDVCMGIDEMTLRKIEELAKHTSKKGDEKSSLFSKMVRDGIKKRPETSKTNLLEMSVHEFMVFEKENTSEILLAAVKDIRSRWYNNLIRAVGM